LLEKYNINPDAIEAEAGNEEAAEYSNMKVDALRKLCIARDIEIPNDAKKENLISLLLNSTAA